MIEFGKVKVGDKLEIVGVGAPGFAKLGDIVTVTEVGHRRVDVVRDDGEQAYFALTCRVCRAAFRHVGYLGRQHWPER